MNLIPKEPADTWVIVGMAYYITDTFMRKLCGNNEYRFRMKQMSDRVCDMDYERPSIYDMGNYLKLDPSELEFIELKAPLVLFILERRLAKASGKPTMSRIISRLLLNARMGDLANGAVTTSYFIRTCEKIGHAKLDVFFNQWVYGAGCPRFTATQRFNKKKLVVEIMIKQVQGENQPPRNLEKQNFMRDVKEEIRSVYAGAVQPVFTGSMTIRIHEADGTPYEHIVEIKEGVTKLDIPYNTKYKRLKRSKRQRERAVAASGGDSNQELENDVLLYCLGDVLQSDEEMREWRLADWSKEEEERMGQESYEWIRMDADFEWICKLSLAMPGYMYLSQLQQDRDVVAQLEVCFHLQRYDVLELILATVHAVHGGPAPASACVDDSGPHADGSAIFPRHPCNGCAGIGQARQGGNQLAWLVPSGESVSRIILLAGFACHAGERLLRQGLVYPAESYSRCRVSDSRQQREDANEGEAVHL